MNSIGERIFELRKIKGLSQGELADKLNISRQTVSKWENNMSAPEIEKLIMLSDIFDVTVDYIVRGEHTEKEPASPVVTERIIIKENTKNTDIKKFLGIGLLLVSLVLFFMMPIDFYYSLFVAIIGIILLAVKKRAEIYAAWFVFISLNVFLTFSTAISPLQVFDKSFYNFSDFGVVHILDLLLWAVLFVLILWTKKVRRKKNKDN